MRGGLRLFFFGKSVFVKHPNDHSRLPASFHLQPPRHLQYQDEGGSGKIYEESLYKEDNFYNEGYLFRQE